MAREIEGSHLALAGGNAPKPASPTQASGYHPRAAQLLGDKQQLTIGNRHLAKYQLLIANCQLLRATRPPVRGHTRTISLGKPPYILKSLLQSQRRRR